jgi:actin-like ATPase involved in cell morphogenesis
MSPWDLGIDFGTSYTVAAVARDGNVTTVDVESNGRSRLPSSVFLSLDGQILVGTAAQHQAVFAPERYEPTPKRVLGEGELFLGDRLIAVSELAAAVLRRVYTEACRQQGETAPAAVRITHPADWNESRKSILREAVEKAGMPDYELMTEPVAAAVRISLAGTQPGQTIAVYDFGGGTFDAAVLLRTSDGFEIAGPPAGRDPLGGEDIDVRIVNYLGEVLADEYPEDWPKLLDPPDVSWRHKASDLREEVQRAKETLSEVTVCQLWVPGIERDVQLTRDELEDLIVTDIDATVDCLQRALDDANVKAKDLAGIYLVGGSSRIPLVGTTIYRRLDVMPSVQDNPKSVVALGAASWDMALKNAVVTKRPEPPVVGGVGVAGATPRPGPGPEGVGGQPPQVPAGVQTAAPGIATQPVATTPGASIFRSAIVMAVGIDAWPEGCACVSELVIEFPGPPAISLRARDEPASVGNVHQLAGQVGAFRAARTPGFVQHWVGPAQVLGDTGVERRFSIAAPQGSIPMFEQYLIVSGRALVIAGAEASRGVAATMRLRPNTMAPEQWFESRFSVECPPRWSPNERVNLRRNVSNHAVTAEQLSLPAGMPDGEWRKRQLDALFIGFSGASLASHVAGPVLNHFDGEILTVRWNNRGVPMLTKRGLAVSGRTGYMVTITLPFSDQSQFSPLARQARLHPDIVAMLTSAA